MPSGATVTGVDYENHVGRYRTGSRTFEVAVMKSGSSQSSTMIDPASYTYVQVETSTDTLQTPLLRLQ